MTLPNPNPNANPNASADALGLPFPEAETLRFLERVLPAAPARLLEVGFGDGRIAAALAARGYGVTALDEVSAPAPGVAREGVAWIASDFLFFEGAPDAAPFDAILFTRSLHHIAPLDRALDHAASLLAPGGLLVAEEFAVERVNHPTARWWYDLEAVLVAGSVLSPPDPALAAIRNPLGRWRQEHAADPPLATGHAMLAGVRERFETGPAEEAPYLYREVAARATAAPGTADRVVRQVHEIEERLIRERDIAAAGLRIVGTRPA
ncbi:MAG TPA: class I SAM-dependent methyltransferase [Candidatus Eisenbacteria bacterium]|nr:class I SAM-dependent methyltransferase [Candidatus Eisenbacteria bacterium]